MFQESTKRGEAALSLDSASKQPVSLRSFLAERGESLPVGKVKPPPKPDLPRPEDYSRPLLKPADHVTDAHLPPEAPRFLTREEYNLHLIEPINFLASSRQYLDHLLPIWQALPYSRRGIFFVAANFNMTNGEDLYSYALQKEIEGLCPFYDYPVARGPLVVAGYGDLIYSLYVHDRPVCLTEHGVGRYIPGGFNPGYSGGTGLRALVGLFMCPNTTSAKRNQETFPDARVRTIGYPKMDRYAGINKKPMGIPPVIAVTTHWDCEKTDFMRSGLDEFLPAIKRLKEHFEVIGTGHPRDFEKIKAKFEGLNIPVYRDLETIFEKADLLVGDFTSAVDEFAFLGRPVVRYCTKAAATANEGAFFESKRPGIVVYRHEDLLPAVNMSLRDPEALQTQRKEAVEAAFTYTDGKSAHRAVEALIEWTEEKWLPPQTT